MKYEYLVLSGGGVKGVGLIGALQILDEHDCLANLHTFVGSSIGAMIAAMLVIGYKPQEQFDVMCNINIQEMQEIDIWKLFTHFGLDAAAKIVKYIKTLFRAKNIPTDITFEQLYQLTGKRLIITGTCVNTHKIEYFDDNTTQKLSVIDAIRISISIPFLFTSPKYNGNQYVDGGLLDNFPLTGVQSYIKPGERVLALTLSHSYEKISSNTIVAFETFSTHLIYTLLDEIDHLRQEIYHIKRQTKKDAIIAKQQYEIEQLKLQLKQKSSQPEHDQSLESLENNDIEKLEINSEDRDEKLEDCLDILFIDTEQFHSFDFDLKQKDKDKLFNLGQYNAARFLEGKIEIIENKKK